MSNYAFFVKYTYSNECALLAYNFHELVSKLQIFDIFAYRHDHRLISVTLAYILYRYQVGSQWARCVQLTTHGVCVAWRKIL